MKTVLSMAFVGVFVSGCATVTRGDSEDVKFSSAPSGASVQTTNGFNCTTPCTLRMKRKEEFVATFTRAGKVRKVEVGTEVSGAGGTAMAGNVLIGGVIGVGIDAATGASLNHVPNPVHVDFNKKAPVVTAAAVKTEQPKDSSDKEQKTEKRKENKKNRSCAPWKCSWEE